MNTAFKTFALWLAMTPMAYANMLAIPLAGNYSVQEDNIVKISGQTMVKNNETKLFSCEGQLVASLANNVYVEYELVEPVEGPIPVLKVVKAQCY